MHTPQESLLFISKSTYAPDIKSLCTLYKSLVRSRNPTSKSYLQKIDTAFRSILRIVLGSKPSTNTEVIYAETGTEPVFQTVATEMLPKPQTNMLKIKLTTTALFKLTEVTTDQVNKRLPPWSPPLTIVKWFPMRKSDAPANLNDVQHLLESMISETVAPDITIYTYGSVNANPIVTSCAFYIPVSDSWRLTLGSSISSVELHGIKQALSTIYTYDPPPPGIHIFTRAPHQNRDVHPDP